MCKKLVYLTSFVLVLFLASNAFSVDDPSDMADSSGDIKRIEAWVEDGNLNLTMTVYGVFAPEVQDTPAGMTNRYYYHWLLDTDTDSATGYNNSEYEGNATNVKTPIGVDLVVQFGWRDGNTNGVYAYDPLTEVSLFEDYEYTIDGDTIHAVIPLEDLGLDPGQTIAVSAFQEGASNDWQVDWLESFELTLTAIGQVASVDDPSDMADSSGDIKRIEAWVEDGNLNLTMTVYGVFAPEVQDTPAGMTNRYYYHWLLDTDTDPVTGYNNSEYEGNATNVKTPIGVDLVVQFGWRDGNTNGVYAYDPLTEVSLFEDYEYTIDGDTIHAVIPLEDLGLDQGQTIALSAFQEGASNDWQVDWIESFELTLTAIEPEPIDPGTDGLVAFYALDGDATDSSGNGNDGTLFGDQLEWVEGKAGSALSHGGLSDAGVEFPTTGMSATAGTVAMWGLLTDPQPAQTKYFFGHTTQPQWSNRVQLYMDDGDNLLDLGLGDSHNRQNDIVELSMEEWLHVALTWDAGDYVVYLNGENVATGTYTGMTDVNEVANIGNDGSRAPYEAFAGLLDEVAIYSRALSTGEVRYLAGFRPPDDVTAPGDVVKGVPDEARDGSVAGWPDGEYPGLAVDDDVSTKFLHFRGEVSPTGFVVEPASGSSVVTKLTFTTANDAPERDPISFELSGSNDSIDGPYTLIASGDIVDFAGADAWPRFTMNATPISFDNDVAYKYYQVMFPAVRDAASANSMQIAEIELLGTVPFTAYNDCVYDADQDGTGTDPTGQAVHYIAPNVTTFGVGSGFSGSSSGELLDQKTGNPTGVIATLTESGGVVWQPQNSGSFTGGYDTAVGTDAYDTFNGIADMTGVIYYGSTGWYVDLTLTGLNPNRTYTFATSASRSRRFTDGGGDGYADRNSIYTISGVDAATNASTPGTEQYLDDPLSVWFNTGNNHDEGYVARWTDIDPGPDGSFTVRAEAHPDSNDGGRKAYSFDVFMLQELAN
jgi:hypothetical protein